MCVESLGVDILGHRLNIDWVVNRVRYHGLIQEALWRTLDPGYYCVGQSI